MFGSPSKRGSLDFGFDSKMWVENLNLQDFKDPTPLKINSETI